MGLFRSFDLPFFNFVFVSIKEPKATGPGRYCPGAGFGSLGEGEHVL
jgi:hypothetical protein